MVHPLIGYDQRTFRLCQVRYRIFCKHSDAVGINELWNAVVNFRVKMVWTTCKHDTARMIFLKVCEDLLALFVHVAADRIQLFPCCVDRLL